MIAYLDTSALLKLVHVEDGSAEATRLWDEAERRVSSRLAYPESRAALAAARRAGRLTAQSLTAARRELESRFEEINAVEATDALCRTAGDLAERHGLRGYDAVHLASATAAATQDLIFLSWDDRLAEAARAEGLLTVP